MRVYYRELYSIAERANKKLEWNALSLDKCSCSGLGRFGCWTNWPARMLSQPDYEYWTAEDKLPTSSLWALTIGTKGIIKMRAHWLSPHYSHIAVTLAGAPTQPFTSYWLPAYTWFVEWSYVKFNIDYVKSVNVWWLCFYPLLNV